MRYRALTGLAILILVCGLQASDESSGQKAPQVERVEFVRISTFTGELEAAESVRVTAPSISSLWRFTVSYLVEEGRQVAAGDLVAKFDASELVLKRLQAEKKAKEARLKIAEKQAEIESRRQELLIAKARAEKDLKVAELDSDIDPQLIARSQYEERLFKKETTVLALEKAEERLKTHGETAQADLDVIRLEFQRADLERSRIMRDLARMRVHAPAAGLVLYQENWSTGRKMQVGDNIFQGQTIMVLPKLERFVVKARVHHSDVDGLRLGESVEVILDAYPGRSYRGHIAKLPEFARTRSAELRLKSFVLQVALEEADRELMKPGMTARVMLRHEEPDILTVPRNAIHIAADGTPFVLTDETPSRRIDLRLLDANQSRVAVEGGLTQGLKLKPARRDELMAEEREIKWIPVKRDNLDFHISSNGELEAASSSFVRPPSLPNSWNFKIAAMAPEGIQVKPGDFLVQFDPTDFQKRLVDAQADLAKVEKELEKNDSAFRLEIKDLELELEQAKTDLEKAGNKLIEAREFKGGREAQKARLEEAFARFNLEALSRKMESRKASQQLRLDTIKDKIAFYQARVASSMKAMQALTVKSTISGVLIYVPNWRNEKKKVGDQVYMAQNLFSIPDLNTLRVKAQVSEIDAGKLKLGQTVLVTVDALPDESFRGKISEIGTIFGRNSADQVAKMVQVRVSLDQVDAKRMRPEMAARLKIVVDHFENVVAVPLSVIRVEGDQSYVWVKTEGSPQRRRVEVGRNNGIVAIIDSGLEDGDEIAERPPTEASTE